jgi:hypothetical protein
MNQERNRSIERPKKDRRIEATNNKVDLGRNRKRTIQRRHQVAATEGFLPYHEWGELD